jgi:hypothetical protein
LAYARNSGATGTYKPPTTYSNAPMPSYVQDLINKSKAPAAPAPKAPTTKYVAPKTTYTAPKVPAPVAPPKPAATTNSSYGGGVYNPKTGVVTNQDGSTETKFIYEDGVPINAGTGAVLPQVTRQDNMGQQGATPDQTTADILTQILAALNQPQQPQQPTFDRAAAERSIRGWGDNLKNSLKSKIEAARQSGLSQYANAGTLATQQTASSLNQNAVEKANAIQQILQASEAAGQGRGGMNVTGQIAANTRSQQNANEARMNLGNNLNAIETAKAGINTQADQQNIQSEADVEAQVLQAILDAEKFGANIDLQGRGLDLQNKEFEFNSDLKTKQFTSDESWREWQKQFEIENQAWQRSPDNPQMQAQVLANKSAILNNQLAALELQNYPEEQKLRLQKIRSEIAQIGKAPAVSDYDSQMNNIKLEQARVELENVKKGQKTDYTPFINQLYLDPTTGILNKAGLIDYLQNLSNSGVSEAEVRAYATKYGVSL